MLAISADAARCGFAVRSKAVWNIAALFSPRKLLHSVLKHLLSTFILISALSFWLVLTTTLCHYSLDWHVRSGSLNTKVLRRVQKRLSLRPVNGLREFLQLERKRIPGDILFKAERLECQLFAGYDPRFDGDEPPSFWAVLASDCSPGSDW